MKTLIIFSFLLLFFLAGYGQEKKSSNISDTTMLVGVVNEDCFIGKEISSSSCFVDMEKYIKKGIPVIIGGVSSCSYSQYIAPRDFYEIYYNNQKYFIERANLTTDELVFFNLKEMSATLSEAFRKNAIRIAGLLYESDSRQLTKFLNSTKSKGIAILNWQFYDESEYTSGTSVKIDVYNPTQKTIKYIWFTFVGYNAVGDKIIDRKRGGNITMQGIGPIKPGENGSYKYDYVWFSDLVETAKVLSLKVQYMDGTILTVSNPKEIILPKNLYQLLSDE